MSKYKYKFSVIIPVYNVENYLSETIESIVNQTIGFEKNIQIILVNDGSPDNSEKICLEYKEKYPNNIIYIKKENGGVSSARNKGLEYVEGEYINFFDSDDIWESDVFEKVYNMFKENNDIDVVSLRIQFFEASNAYPALDFKYNKDKIINIHENYDHIQLSVSAAFIAFQAIKDTRFDTRIKYSEDAKFIFEIILQKEKMGIISSSKYLYRKRNVGNSAIQTKSKDNDWYIVTPELCYQYVFDLSKKKYGKVIPFCQYYVAYDYQFRIKDIIPEQISKETLDKYKKISKKLFSEIDDEIILEQRVLSSEHKIELLNFKHGTDIRKQFVLKKNKLFYKDKAIINLTNKLNLKVTNISFTKEQIEIRGLLNLYLEEKDFKLYAVINEKERIEIKLNDTSLAPRKFFGKTFMNNKGFIIKIDKKNIKNIRFEIEYKNNSNQIVNFTTGLNAKIDHESKLYYINDKKIYYFYNQRIKVINNTIKNRLKFALRRTKYQIKNKKIKAILIRILYYILKLFNKNKKIWLISDRPISANDNGYAFFKYLNETKPQNIKSYFVIDKKSKDFDKVKNTGKYLNYNTLYYKIMFLLADKVISSQADAWVTNPFGKSHNLYHDLYNGDFIFLQHGIIVNDLSNWLNCYDKDIKIFCTTSENEYNSVVKGAYGYGKDIVKLTGLARYDLLHSESEKQIAIMPTWRLPLAGPVNKKTGLREKNPNFIKTEYYEFYSKLINDKELLDVMKKHKYKGIFLVHPSHNANANDFYGNDIIKVETNIADYNKIFCTSNLVITDYSSAPFDFAYLNKPVIYTQFDKKEFFARHLCNEGYFSYEKDGLGPVVFDYENTVKEIIKNIENECELDKKYEERIKKFYKYHDKKNCERIYKEIITMKKAD